MTAPETARVIKKAEPSTIESIRTWALVAFIARVCLPRREVTNS